MSVGLQLIDNSWLHLILCIIYVLTIGCHEKTYLLVKTNCVLRLICRQIEIALLLHTVKEHIFARTNILQFVHHDGLSLGVECCQNIII